MNQLSEQIRQAKKRQKIIVLSLSVAIISSILIIGGGLAFTRSIHIGILPEEAAVIANIDIESGAAIIIGKTLYSLSKTPAIAVFADGYQARIETLDLTGTNKQHTIRLQELPGRLKATINQVKGETLWFLDGLGIGYSDNLEIDVPSGKHQLIIDNKYYQKEIFDFEIKRNTSLEMNFDLQPVIGNINISSNPDKATVTIDGVVAGETPLAFSSPGGSYDVLISHTKYARIEDNIVITRDDNMIERNYLLASYKAQIKFTLNPEGGLLLINGIKTNYDRPVYLDTLKKHEITYQKDGYVLAGKTIRPDSASTVGINFNLAEEFGEIEITTTPKATLFIDNKHLGETPKSLKLQTIPHELVVKKNGYRQITKVIKPAANTAMKIALDLVPELSARLSEVPKQYTHKAGGKMRLYTPNDEIIMGSKRHETGQRANEIIRKIKISRPFYAGVHEVTREEFNKYKKTMAQDLQHPMSNITWLKAAQFCNWLSRQENLKPFYEIADNRLLAFNNTDGYRLLTEAEWEWLARKANKIKQTTFVWGDTTTIPPKTANIADTSAIGRVEYYIPGYTDGFALSAPVGSFNREASGLYDMAGNVSEWVNDLYSETSNNDEITKSIGSARGRLHVVKGANWQTGTITGLRAAYREGRSAGGEEIGFRTGRYLWGGK